MSTPIVDVDQLQKTYRSFSWRGRKSVQAVRGVTLQAYPGEVFGLLGPNGAGKTTLIKMLLGVVKPSSGDATLFSQAIGSTAARRRVGYLPESLRVDRHHTARSALRYYGQMSGMSGRQIDARSDELLDLVGLAGRDRESVRRFSKGMYQRLGLAQALLHDPDLLVLDEPTDGLDPVGRNEVRRVIDRLRDSGKTIFLNSHILQEVELVCTRVAIMAKGQIKAIGPIDDLAQSDKRLLQMELVGIDTSLAESTGVSDQQDTSEGHGLERVMAVSRWHEILGESALQEVRLESVSGALRMTIPVEHQQQIDALVDACRQQSHSISKLEVQRESLEETFMRLVGSEAVASGEATS